MTVGEFLSFVYTRMVEGMSPAQRAEFDRMLTPPQKDDRAQAEPVPAWVARHLAGARSRHERGHVNVVGGPRPRR